MSEDFTYMELKEFILDKEQPIGLDELLCLISEYFDDDELTPRFDEFIEHVYELYKTLEKYRGEND